MFSKFKTWWTGTLSRLGIEFMVVSTMALLMLIVILVMSLPDPPVQQLTPPASMNSATILELTGTLTKQQKALLDSQAQTAQLLTELRVLKGQVETMTRAVATYQVTRTGSFIPMLGPMGPAGPQGTPGQPGVSQSGTPTAYRYQDWRLTFTGDIASQQATYSLNQRFEVNHITGRGPTGTPISLLNVFELAPDGSRTAVPTVTTTTVVNEAPTQWRFAPTIQAGYAGVLVPNSYTPGAVIALQLWKRGQTRAAEDSTWSMFSPTIVLSANLKAIGVAPVSVNLGRIPHQPFKDIWASPLVLFTSEKVWRGGFSVTASF